jgi:hypothetical protein
MLTRSAWWRLVWALAACVVLWMAVAWALGAGA